MGAAGMALRRDESWACTASSKGCWKGWNGRRRAKMTGPLSLRYAPNRRPACLGRPARGACSPSAPDSDGRRWSSTPHWSPSPDPDVTRISASPRRDAFPHRATSAEMSQWVGERRWGLRRNEGRANHAPARWPIAAQVTESTCEARERDQLSPALPPRTANQCMSRRAG